MSLLHATSEVVINLVSAAGGGGFLDWTNNKTNQFLTTARGLGVAGAVVMVIITYFRTRGAIAATVVAGFVAAFMLYVLFNVTDLRDRMEEEVNAGTLTTSGQHAPALRPSSP